MTEISQLPATPAGAPPGPTDTALLMRQTLSAGAAGLAPTGYAVPYSALAPAILPKELVTAGGTSAASATQLAQPVSIVIGATAGGGVLLRGIPHDSQTVLNASGAAVQVYPPSGGTLNGGATGQALNAGAQVDVHSVDGINYYAAS